MNDTLTLAIIGHLVGDYLLQNDWMALNKKQSSYHCWIHCWLWSMSVMFFSGWQWIHPSWKAVLIFAILIITHFIQDRMIKSQGSTWKISPCVRSRTSENVPISAA